MARTMTWALEDHLCKACGCDPERGEVGIMTVEDYNKQFMLRIPESLAKIERIKKIYENNAQIPDTPKVIFEELEKQKARLIQAKEKFGDYITPDRLLS